MTFTIGDRVKRTKYFPTHSGQYAPTGAMGTITGRMFFTSRWLVSVTFDEDIPYNPPWVPGGTVKRAFDYWETEGALELIKKERQPTGFSRFIQKTS